MTSTTDLRSMCSGCRGQITDKSYLVCFTCKHTYDLLCANINQSDFETLTPEYLSSWVCVECHSKIPKSGNSNTPVRGSCYLSSTLNSSTEEHGKVTGRTKNRQIRMHQTPFSPSSHLTSHSKNGGLDVHVRTIMEGELQKSTDALYERLKTTVSKTIAEQVTTSMDKNLIVIMLDQFDRLNGRLSILENKLNSCKCREAPVSTKPRPSEPANITSPASDVQEGGPRNQSEPQGIKFVKKTKQPSTNISSERQNKPSVSPMQTHGSKAHASTSRPPAATMITPPPPPKAPIPEENDWITVCKKNTSKNEFANRTTDNSKATTSGINHGPSRNTKAVSTTSMVSSIGGRESVQPKMVKIGRNDNINMEIKAMEVKRYLHVWKLAIGTTVESMTGHVKSVCGTEPTIKVDKIRHKTERDYASFIITVPQREYEILYQPEVWPVNSEFGEWFWFRRQANRPIEEK